MAAARTRLTPLAYLAIVALSIALSLGLSAALRTTPAVTWWTPVAAGLGFLAVMAFFVRRADRREAEYTESLERQVADRTRELAMRTDQVQAALDAAAEAQQRATQAERLRALGEMTGGVAHDFNNVLAVILGRVELLLVKVSHDPALAAEVRALEQVALDGARTVKRVQEFARLRRSQPFQAVDLNQVVAEVVEVTGTRWRHAAQARGTHYEVRAVAGPIPAIAGDPAELREALTNLILNALDAMPEGGVIGIRTWADSHGIHCEVADSGVGIPADLRHRVFEPFFTTKGERGTGLGLSIVSGIVTRHGGAIDLRSEAGQGAVFTITLPAPLADEAPDHPTPPAEPAKLAGRILVIDDEADIRQVLRTCLQLDGHAVVDVASGPEGLARCEQQAFDLVLTDIAMPEMSGWSVASAVKRRFDLPVGVVTGWADRSDAARLAATHIDFMIEKPFRLDDLRRRVADVLATSKQRVAG
jgi:signal transduction histidine kinase/CheY-like chemotaxis protein